MLFSSLGLWPDLPSFLPSTVSHPYPSNFQASVTFCSNLLRCFELVCFDLVLALGRVFLAPPPSLCCLPLLAVLLVVCHELLSLGCRLSGVCSFSWSEAWVWLLISVRQGFVWGATLAGSTCTAAVLVVVVAAMVEDVAAPVVYVFSLFWSQLLVGPLLFVCPLFLGLYVVKFVVGNACYLCFKKRKKKINFRFWSIKKGRTQCTRLPLCAGSGRGECRLALPPFMERLLPSLEPDTYCSWAKALAIAPSKKFNFRRNP
ncbi:hypothetical protein DVH24_035458 [Malus domestica]|uniref:Transmembrane protein n=1 Tax=Malus domestica TaxID=3750 RepID=A0A498J984_MALDO|nr:hypothetical protein DVH24_035458 [Malus domestica]